MLKVDVDPNRELMPAFRSGEGLIARDLIQSLATSRLVRLDGYYAPTPIKVEQTIDPTVVWKAMVDFGISVVGLTLAEKRFVLAKSQNTDGQAPVEPFNWVSRALDFTYDYDRRNPDNRIDPWTRLLFCRDNAHTDLHLKNIVFGAIGHVTKDDLVKSLIEEAKTLN